MALPELVRKSAEKILARYCRDKVPPCHQQPSRLGFNFRNDHVTLFQEREAGQEQGRWLVFPIAQFRYNHDLNQWTLHYPDGRHRWRFYLNAGPHLDLGKLLQHLDQDPLHTFWA